jgi:crotonobetainyl-CoA:carnitine CoA-transferase CaiB-like acyl-CoA transferase
MLSDLRIIEYGEFVSAPYCSRLFADLGAKVIKVEPPDKGDIARSYGPFPEDMPHPEKSGLYIFLNTGKQSVTLNLNHSEGRKIFKKLLDEADIFITNALPNVMEQWQLDYFSLSKTHRKLIYCAITPFGCEGPYRDYRGFNLHCAALSGASWAIGSPKREPLQIPLSQCDFQGGVNGAAAIMVALMARNKSGRGQFLDISTSDVMATYVGTNAILYLFYGLKWERDGRRAWGSGGPYPYGLFPCKDGLVCLIARTNRDWNRLLDAIGRPDWSNNPRYQDQFAMGREYPDEVDALLLPILKRYTKSELFQMAREYGFPLAPVRSVHESLDEPQLRERSFFEPIQIPEIGTVYLPRLPFQFSNKKFQSIRPAPLLGEHNETVLMNELGLRKEDIRELKEQGVI